jgi:molecular chaperone Hsp33
MFFVGAEGKYWQHPHIVQVACSCSIDKVLGSFRLLGQDEVQKMIIDKEVVDVQCEMCGKQYSVDHHQIKALYQSIKKLH